MPVPLYDHVGNKCGCGEYGGCDGNCQKIVPNPKLTFDGERYTRRWKCGYVHFCSPPLQCFVGLPLYCTTKKMKNQAKNEEIIKFS
jgi:hypothetical protein